MVAAATPQRVDQQAAALPPSILRSQIANLVPSAIHVPSVPAGLAFSGEADPSLSGSNHTLWRSGLKVWVSFCRPSSSRVFTVPSGACVATAISL
jgi:hypothetical protein